MTAADPVEEARSYRAALAPMRGSGSEDGWLLAAAALRQAAVGVPEVDGLADAGAFQTRGRGPAVLGIALSPRLDGSVRADVGLVLASSALAEPDRFAAALRLVRQRLRATWERLGSGTPLDLHLHVVDVGPQAREGV